MGTVCGLLTAGDNAVRELALPDRGEICWQVKRDPVKEVNTSEIGWYLPIGLIYIVTNTWGNQGRDISGRMTVCLLGPRSRKAQG